jgi:hypothetical protein
VLFGLLSGEATVPAQPVITDEGGVATAKVTMGQGDRVVIEARYGSSAVQFELWTTH